MQVTDIGVKLKLKQRHFHSADSVLVYRGVWQCTD